MVHRARERVVAGLAIRPQLLDRGHHQWKERREQLLQQIADEEVLLARLAHNGGRKKGILAARHLLDVKDGILIGE